MMDQTQEFTMQAPQQVFQLPNLWSIFNALLSYDVNLDFSLLCRQMFIISLGWSSCSENSIKQEKCWGNSFCKSRYQLDGFYEDYEEQDVHMWVDLEVEGMHLPIMYDKGFLTES